MRSYAPPRIRDWLNHPSLLRHPPFVDLLRSSRPHRLTSAGPRSTRFVEYGATADLGRRSYRGASPLQQDAAPRETRPHDVQSPWRCRSSSLRRAATWGAILGSSRTWRSAGVRRRSLVGTGRRALPAFAWPSLLPAPRATHVDRVVCSPARGLRTACAAAALLAGAPRFMRSPHLFYLICRRVSGVQPSRRCCRPPLSRGVATAVPRLQSQS